MKIAGRLIILLATIVGLAIAVRAFGDVGVDAMTTIARRIGVGGFLLYCIYSMGVFLILGAAWLAAAPGEAMASLGRFGWARAVREAVADLLPFSQLGGIVVGARTLTVTGMATPRVYASLIVDMTTELASQLVFTLFGVAVAVAVMADGPAAGATRSVLLGAVAALLGIVVAVFVAQHWLPRVGAGLIRQVLPGSASAIAGVGDELTAIYARRDRVLLAFALNLAAWIASAAGAWIVLRLIGVDRPLIVILAVESLIFTLRSVAFAVPGGIGVQEAGYALIAPLLGLPLESALALALAKRARDLALGVPTLVLWQLLETRGIVTARAR